MKNNIQIIHQLFQNSFLKNISQINDKLYPKPYFLDGEEEEEEPILFI